MVAGSGSGYGGGCHCDRKGGSNGLGSDVGLLAAAGLGFFLIYMAITMMRRKRSPNGSANQSSSFLDDFIWEGKIENSYSYFSDI